MYWKKFTGCCQAVEIYGFGNSRFDGAGEKDLSSEEFERLLLQKEKDLDHLSLKVVTINCDQYKVYGKSLKKLGWKLVNVSDSQGHPTVVFLYVKNSSKVSEERIKQRLTNKGIKVTLPRRKLKKT